MAKKPKLVVIEQMKNEIAQEFGIDLQSHMLTSRQAGYVGGNITRRLIAIGEEVISKDRD